MGRVFMVIAGLPCCCAKEGSAAPAQSAAPSLSSRARVMGRCGVFVSGVTNQILRQGFLLGACWGYLGGVVTLLQGGAPADGVPCSANVPRGCAPPPLFRGARHPIDVCVI